MARITVEDCLTKIPNRFQLVLAATYRARMLSQGHAPKIENFSVCEGPPLAGLEERAFMEITPPVPTIPPVEAAHSSAGEEVLEHLFVGELLRCLWRRSGS